MAFEANEAAIRSRREAADLPGIVKVLGAAGFGLYAVAELLLLIAFLGDAEGVKVDIVMHMVFRFLAVMTLAGTLILGGAFAPRLALWARITMLSVGVFVAISTGGFMGMMSAFWFGAF